MSLRRLGGTKPVDFDPIEEARRVFAALGFDRLSSEAYVFGSASDGTFSDESDIDVLAVFDTKDLLNAAQAKLLERPVSEWPFDWILKLRPDFEARSQSGGVCFIALREGIKIR